MRQILIIAVLLFTLCHLGSGDKILFFFAGGSYSHKNSVWPWVEALATKHDVTFLSAYEKSPAKNPKVNDLSSKTLYKLMSKSYDIDRFTIRERGEEMDFLSSYSKYSVEICETILLNSQDDAVLQNVFRNQTFDLVIVNIIFGECGFIFGHHYKAKTIVYDASVMLGFFYDVYGFLPEKAWIPDILKKYEDFPLSFTDRMFNELSPLYWFWGRWNYMYPEFERIMKSDKVFGNKENLPSFYELEKNASLVFVNTHHASDFANSLPPFVIPIGGMNTWLTEKQLPHQFEKFMDGAGPGGVVLISFGSTIRLENVPSYYSNIFFDLIKKHKNVRFLLKWGGSLPKSFAEMDNLLVSDWLPQREILRHPKLRAFVSHAGLNSIHESVYYSVPMITIPLFADQDYNAYRIEAQNVGLRLEIRDLTFDLMDKSLTKILADEKYRKNMQIKSKLFRDRPQSPLDTAVFWTEFTLRHNDLSSMKPMNSHQTWYQRRLIDVYLAFGVIIATLFFVVLALFVMLFRLVCKRNKPIIKDKKKRS